MKDSGNPVSGLEYLSRLEQLNDDNAFVNVNDVLKSDGLENPSSSLNQKNCTSSFLHMEVGKQKPSRSGVTDANMRVNITAALTEQHNKYLLWLGDHAYKQKRTLLRQREQYDGNHNVKRKFEIDDMELPSQLWTEKACLNELQRELKILETWKYDMIHKKIEKRSESSRSSLENFAEVHITCPSFEAMTAPSIRRSFKSNYFLKGPKKAFIRSGSRKWIDFGALHHKVCSICLLPAAYKCVRCQKAFFCSAECHRTHDAARCLKFLV